MPSLTHFTTALLFGTALSLPASSSPKKKDFTVHQVAGAQVLKNGPAELVKALNKYGKPAPKHLVDAASARVAGASAIVVASSSSVSSSVRSSAAASSTAASSTVRSSSSSSTPTPSPSPKTNTGSNVNSPEQYDRAYISPVTVGGTVVNLNFDTGSADLWVLSSLMSRSLLLGHRFYTAPTAKQVKGSSWYIRYGDGSGATGLVYADSVTVGGVTAPAQYVEAATSVSRSLLYDYNSDGILGLSFSSINTVSPKKTTTFFDTVKSSLTSPLFAVTLKKGAPGSYDFGYIDPAKYSGSLTYAPVDSSRGFWMATASGYTINGTTTTSPISGIFDTGTSLILLDPAVVTAYYAKVQGSQAASSGYVFPCTAALPDFSIIINGVPQTVPGSYMNYAPAGGSMCYGGIQSNSGLGLSIFGDVFLKSKYVVFDSAGPRIGFANQK